jgi:hypothetical protein
MNQINIVDVDNNLIESNITEEKVIELMNREIATDQLNYFMWPHDDVILSEMKSSEYSESMRFIKILPEDSAPE